MLPKPWTISEPSKFRDATYVYYLHNGKEWVEYPKILRTQSAYTPTWTFYVQLRPSRFLHAPKFNRYSEALEYLSMALLLGEGGNHATP